MQNDQKLTKTPRPFVGGGPTTYLGLTYIYLPSGMSHQVGMIPKKKRNISDGGVVVESAWCLSSLSQLCTALPFGGPKCLGCRMKKTSGWTYPSNTANTWSWQNIPFSLQPHWGRHVQIPGTFRLLLGLTTCYAVQVVAPNQSLLFMVFHHTWRVPACTTSQQIIFFMQSQYVEKEQSESRKSNEHWVQAVL